MYVKYDFRSTTGVDKVKKSQNTTRKGTRLFRLLTVLV